MSAVVKYSGGDTVFRKIKEDDLDTYLRFVDEFYHTDVVESPVPKENYYATFKELMRSDEYVECFIFEEDDKPCGFALISKTFSQEAGGLSVTIEEIYIDKVYRGRGLGTEFFKYLFERYDAFRFRLEVEDENYKAKKLYESLGFKDLPYKQMVIDKWKQDL